MFTISLYGKKDYRTSAWSGGTTTELFIDPPDGDYMSRNFAFRISSAEVNLEASIFSDLAGFHRLIATLEHPLFLEHPERGCSKLLQPYEFYRFEGGWRTQSRGKTRDFNLIYSDEWQVEAISLNEASSRLSLEADAKVFIFSHKAQALSLNIDDEKQGTQQLNLKLEDLGLLALTAQSKRYSLKLTSFTNPLLLLKLKQNILG